MKEREIRPEGLMKENARLVIEDANQLLLQRKRFVEIPCPACESKDYREIFGKQGFTFVSCPQCESLFINPRPTLEMLTHYYATAKSIMHWNSNIFPTSEEKRREQIFFPRAKKVSDLCQKYDVKTDVLLDVGAGFGTFCEEIKKFSLFSKIIAIEPAHSLAETCRLKGINVIEKPIEEVIINSVSVITNFELIEHLFWPKDFLLACKKSLAEGGLLILTTPNIKGFDLQLLGKISDNIGGPNHLNYFHPESLSRLLLTCGFKILEVLTPGKLDVDIVRNKILKGEFDLPDCFFLKDLLMDEKLGEAFQNFLVENKRSSHMWIVAVKSSI